MGSVMILDCVSAAVGQNWWDHECQEVLLDTDKTCSAIGEEQQSVSDWPPQSLELNSIDLVWTHLDRQKVKKQPSH